MNRIELKERAKASLKGKYGDAIAMMAIIVIMCFIFTVVCSCLLFLFLNSLDLQIGGYLVDLIFYIVALVLTSLFGFGMKSYYLKVSRNQDVTWKEMFKKMNMTVPFILISIAVPFILIIFLTGLIAFYWWLLLLIIPVVISVINYRPVYMIKLDNPDMSVKEVIRKSKEMMHGHKMEYFLLSLSFVGWAILGVFTFYILYLWLIPYMNVTYANFYNSLKEQETTN